MPWIETIGEAAAKGLLSRIYEAARKRAGKVFNIVSVQSQQPAVLRASMELYTRIMLAEDEPLTRAQREMIATAVSRATRCEY